MMCNRKCPKKVFSTFSILTSLLKKCSKILNFANSFHFKRKSDIQKVVVLKLPLEISSHAVVAKVQIMHDDGDKPFLNGFRISEKIRIRDSDTNATMIAGISN